MTKNYFVLDDQKQSVTVFWCMHIKLLHYLSAFVAIVRNNLNFYKPVFVKNIFRFDLKEDEQTEDERNKKLQILTGLLGTNFTQFGKKIIGSVDLDADCDNIIELLKAKGPSAIEIEISSLAPEGGGSKELMIKFLKLVLSTLKSRKNFEAVQAYLGLFLKLHSDVVMQSSSMMAVIADIQDEQEKSWTDLKGQLASSSALLAFYKSSLVA